MFPLLLFPLLVFLVISRLHNLEVSQPPSGTILMLSFANSNPRSAQQMWIPGGSYKMHGNSTPLNTSSMNAISTLWNAQHAPGQHHEMLPIIIHSLPQLWGLWQMMAHAQLQHLPWAPSQTRRRNDNPNSFHQLSILLFWEKNRPDPTFE